MFTILKILGIEVVDHNEIYSMYQGS